jgi:hypothetical protein
MGLNDIRLKSTGGLYKKSAKSALQEIWVSLPSEAERKTCAKVSARLFTSMNHPLTRATQRRTSLYCAKLRAHLGRGEVRAGWRDGVRLGPGKDTCGQDGSKWQNGSIETSFEPTLFSLDSSFKCGNAVLSALQHQIKGVQSGT